MRPGSSCSTVIGNCSTYFRYTLIMPMIQEQTQCASCSIAGMGRCCWERTRGSISSTPFPGPSSTYIHFFTSSLRRRKWSVSPEQATT